LVLVGDEIYAPYERPPLSKNALIAPEEPLPTTIIAPDKLTALSIGFLSGKRAQTIDRATQRVELSDGRHLDYDRLLLATGARARALPTIGGERALTLRTYPEALKLRSLLVPRARLVVVGAGFIGLELAASARQRGCLVTVIEMAERVMSRLVPASVAERIAQRHRAAGVDVRCGAAIARIDGSSSEYRVVLDSGETLACDLVVAGIGALPNVELAATAGLSIENGIRVDETLATSDPAIYAAGDCCSFPHPAYGGRRVRLEAWRGAQDQAAAVAGNLLGRRRPCDAIPWFWSDQYELGLQIAGLPGSATTEVVRLRHDGGFIHFGLDSSMALVAASGIAEGTGIARDIRLCQILISRRITLKPAELADPAIQLKSLLTTPSPAR
jgi:3-phenylpropionate/trans-cinnamate dioxygenase ferredoxin reductase subunit